MNNPNLISLRTYIDSNNIDVPSFLAISLNLTHLVQEKHQTGQDPMYLNPTCIFLNSETKQIELAAQEQAAPITNELIYAAPEQFGRMNLPYDHRSDLYIVGIILYEMLTKRLPFDAEDALEWVHAHMAVLPVSPHKLHPDIPVAVSQIVLKLLAKTADGRYQSAYGLAHDLEKCKADWLSTAHISPFVVGEWDRRSQFRNSHKLYGREKQIQALQAALERVRTGSMELLLIEGISGSGKTLLAREIQTMVRQSKGYYVEGKFDQLEQDIPYFSLVQMFRDLVRQLLAENEQQVMKWQQRLKLGLGQYGSVITQFIPEIAFIVGEQPPMEKLSPADSAKRFQTAFLKLIYAITDKHYPFVIFLDDLQWADKATLDLLHTLLDESNHAGLLIIAAYREELTESAHPRFNLFDPLRKSVQMRCLIQLKELEYSQVVSLIADALSSGTDEMRPLAEVLFQKTAGNPLYLNLILESIQADKLLYFDVKQGIWQWELEAIKARESFSDVIQIISSKFSKLPHSTQTVLRLASCIGNTFDLQLLAQTYGHDLEQTMKDLIPARVEGLILQTSIEELTAQSISSSEKYVFLHDRVQQAVYDTLIEEQKRIHHLHIGRLMQQHCDTSLQDQSIFDLVYHLNYASSILTDPEERRLLAELNLRAGQQAKTNAAFATALSLLKMGLALCDTKSGNQPDALYDQLMLERSECEYMCGDIAQAETILNRLMQQAKTPLERGQIYLIQINMYSYQNDHDQVLETTLQVLGELGFHIPRKPSGLRILYEMLRTHRLLQKNLEGTIELPELQDPKYKLMGNILVAAASHISIADDTLMAYIFPKYVSKYMKYGVSEAFAFMMCSNAAFLFLAFDRYSFGIRTAEVAELLFKRLDKQFSNRLLEGKIHFLRATMLQYYNPLESNFRYEKGIALGWETGDDIYVDYDMGLHGLNALGPLEELNKLYQKYLEMMKRFINPVSQRSLQLGVQYIQALKGERDDWQTLGEQVVQVDQPARLYNQFYYYYASCRIEIHYLFGYYSEALDLVKQSYIWKKNNIPIHVQQVILYRFLSITAIYPQLSLLEKAKNRLILQQLLRKMKKWSVRSVQSAEHKYLLMSAEWARLEGKDMEAMQLYDAAIQASKDAGYLQHIATARELAANYYLARGMNTIAELYLVDAYHGFVEWGADQKVKQMRAKYPLLQDAEIHNETSQENADLPQETIALSSNSLMNQLDMDTLRQAATILSIEAFLDLAILNAGAEKGLVILDQNGTLTVAAQKNVNQAESLIGMESIALSVIHFVMRTREPVVLDDALQSLFASDPYIIRDRPKSILCLPLQNSDQTYGVIYLENSLTSHAFPAHRLEMIDHIFSRMSYTQLQKKQPEKDKVAGVVEVVQVKTSPALIESLTKREIEVLQLMNNGMSNKEIAAALEIKEGTIKNHGFNIYGKLQVKSRIQAITVAKELKLIK